MANKKYTDFAPNSTPALSDVILVSNPTTGALTKITLTQLQTLIGGSGGGGSTTLATPTGLTITPANTQLTISWSAVANATSYTVQDSLDGVNYFTSYEGATPSTVLSSLTNGTLYYIRVKATAAGYTDSAWATGSGTPASGSSFDTDAQAFITAASISNSTQQNAINDLVLALKAASIWNKMDAVYPFVGGSAAAHKFNLRNPADTNGAYRLAFAGTVTHNANGITGDGTSGYADTFYNPSTGGMTDTSAHISAYVRSCTANNGIGNAVIGAKQSTNEVILVSDFANLTYAALFNTGDFMNESPTTGRTGTFVVSRTSASSAKMFRNGSLIEEVTGAAGTPPNSKILLLNQAEDLVPQSSFSDANLAFVSIGDGLTDTECTNLRTAIVNFQTALSRNI